MRRRLTAALLGLSVLLLLSCGKLGSDPESSRLPENGAGGSSGGGAPAGAEAVNTELLLPPSEPAASTPDGEPEPPASGVNADSVASPEPDASDVAVLEPASAEPAAAEPEASEPAADVADVADGGVLCGPIAGGPYWLEEGQAVSFSVTCSTGLVLGADAFTISELPSGAVYDAATATLSWTPGLSQAAVYNLELGALDLGETGTVKLGVADKFYDPDNTPVLDPTIYSEEYGLPVIHLDPAPEIHVEGAQSGDDVEYVPAQIVFRGTQYMAEAKYRGHSSFQYPKKNFTLRFAKENKLNDSLTAGGLFEKRKLALITTFDDVSHLRYRLALALWNMMDTANIQVQQFGAVLYLDGEYHGLYAAADKLDGNLFQAHGYDDDGDLFMAIDHNANFASWRYDEPEPQNQSREKDNLAIGFEKKEGLVPEEEEGAYDSIADFTQFVASSTDAAFSSELPERIDLVNYYNWMIHAMSIQAFDSFAKNALHYRDPLTNGPWRVVVWDFNESLGQRWQTERFPGVLDPLDIIFQQKDGYGYSNRNWLWRRIWNHPEFGAQLDSRFSELLRGTLSVENVLAQLDSIASELSPHAARDARLWQQPHQNYFEQNRDDNFQGFDGEVAYIRDFIERRWAQLLELY